MALNPEQQAELNKLLEKGAAITADQKARLSELFALEKALTESAESRAAELDRQTQKLTEQIAYAKELAGLGDRLVGISEQELDFKQRLVKLEEDRNKIAELRAKAKETEAQADIDALKRAQEALQTAKAKLDNEEAGAEAGKSILKNVLGISKEHGIMEAMWSDPAGTIGGMFDAIEEGIDPLSVGTSLLKKGFEATVQLALAQDQAVTNFRKATGASGEFDNNIRVLERSLFTAGVTSEEASAAVQSLYITVTGFSEMSEETQRTVGETVAVLAELGVNAQTTAENIQFATKVMGMSGEQAEELTRDLFTFAQELQVSGDQIASDFQKMGPTIAALGDQGVQAFKDLQVQAKATGLAMDTMLQVTAQFDKFDTAAASVGRLNALLGGPYLNTLQMVTETDPSKRMDLMRDATLEAGLAYEDLDYYQKKAYTSALGLNNEMELAMFLGGNMDDIRPPEKSAEEMEQLAKQTAQFNTIMEELKQAAMGLGVALGPVVSALKWMMQWITPFIKNLDVLITGLATYGLVLKGVAIAKAMLAGSVMLLSKAEKTSIIIGGIFILTSLIGMLGGAFKSLATGIGIATAAVLALGAAEKMTVVLGVIGIVVALVGALVHSLVVGNSPSLAMAFMMVAAAVLYFGLAMLPLLPLLLPLIAAAIPLALAFAGVAMALSEMVSDDLVKNLQLIGAEVERIVDKINELDSVKAVALTATTSVMAASTLDAAAAGAVTRGAPTTAAAPVAAGATSGPAPRIDLHVKLNIDGKELTTSVNRVHVDRYVEGERSNLYRTITDIIKEGFAKGS